MTVLCRTLTKKSKLGFSKYKNYTVEDMLKGQKRKLELVSMYYKLEKINFTEDVLLELGITDEWRIQKPCKNKDVFIEFTNKFYRKTYVPTSDKTTDTLKKMMYSGRERKRTNKSYNQGKNHNR